MIVPGPPISRVCGESLLQARRGPLCSVFARQREPQRLAGDKILILTTCNDAGKAAELASMLVTDGLAACVSTIANVTSTYRWEDNVERADELLLLVKTTDERYADVEAAITRLSGYELPEVIAVRIDRGLPAYLNWIATNTQAREQSEAT